MHFDNLIVERSQTPGGPPCRNISANRQQIQQNIHSSTGFSNFSLQKRPELIVQVGTGF